MSTTQNSLEQVENFWNNNLCGKHFITTPYPSPEFFEQYTRYRYGKTHHLDTYIDWASAKGKKVLEIGLGIGADGCRWAEHAGSYNGMDLTFEAVEATKKHLEVRGLSGHIVQGNAENTPFPDQEFDIIYSHGVLNHTTNIMNAFREVHRMLAQDGKFILMVYNKTPSITGSVFKAIFA